MTGYAQFGGAPPRPAPPPAATIETDGAPSHDPLVSAGPALDADLMSELFRAWSASTPIGLYLIADGVFAWVNAQFERVTGYPVAELLGRPPLEIVHPDDRPQVRAHATAMLKGERREGYTYRCTARDGSVRWIMETVASVPWRGGRAAVGNFVDVTAQARQRAANDRLARQRDRALSELRAVLDATHEGIALIAPDGTFLTVNRRLMELFGVDAAAVVGRGIADVEPLVRCVFADPEAFLQWLASGPQHNAEEPFCETFVQAWPERRELEFFTAPVRGADGAHMGRLYSVRDVTRERSVDRMKSEFVSLVSHELRTPLTSIRGYADLLAGGEVGALTDDQQAFTGIIKANADRLMALVNDLLDIARMESGRVELRLRAVPLREAVEPVLALLAPQIAAKAQRLTVSLPDELPPLLADADRLVQVLTNLVCNAIKYTPPGGAITVAAARDGAGVRVEVRDTGVGMTPEERAQLFTKFYRASNAAVRETGGTGLGLAIAKMLVEMHGGALTVASAPDAGSTFAFTIPCAEPSAA